MNANVNENENQNDDIMNVKVGQNGKKNTHRIIYFKNVQ